MKHNFNHNICKKKLQIVEYPFFSIVPKDMPT